MFITRFHHLPMDEFDVTACGEFTKGRHGEPMAMLPTLPLEKNNWTFRQSCQKVPWATCYFEPLLVTLPEALWCNSVFLYEMKRNDAITYRSAVLPNHVPGPVFLRRISASWRLAHYVVVMARFAEAISNWAVIQFSFPGAPRWHPWKQKKDHDMIRPITENVPCGRSNRNPSNIMNILAFLNVRMQCNISGTESQCFTGDEMQSLRCAYFCGIRFSDYTGGVLRRNLGRLLYDLIIL